MPIPTVLLNLNLDPWSSSSLLQKAIRRGEVELAQAAARNFYRQRGNGIWRRLITIAFEDVGIAAPQLVSETTWLGTDKSLRAAIGEDIQIALDLVRQLAEAPKDRSADYLYSGASKAPMQTRKKSPLFDTGSDALAKAADPSLPLLQRAAHTLAACTVDGAGLQTSAGYNSELLAEALDTYAPSPLNQAALRAAAKRCHPIVLMVPLLWADFAQEAGEAKIAKRAPPKDEFFGTIPLYTYDMHTWVGKQAIRRLSQENRTIKSLLSESAIEGTSEQVAMVAAFYADASPISKELVWSKSKMLEGIGRTADLVSAGCVGSRVEPVVECITSQLTHLNAIRREIVIGRGRK